MNKLITALTILLITGTANAEMTVESYKQLKAQNAEMMKMLVGVMGTGMYWVNGEAKLAHKTDIYCRHGKGALAHADYMKILDAEIEAFDKRAGEGAADIFLIGAFLLSGLQRTYPCEAK